MRSFRLFPRISLLELAGVEFRAKDRIAGRYNVPLRLWIHSPDGARGILIMNRVVVIAASAGGLAPLLVIINCLPVTCAASVFVVLHTGPYPSTLPSLLKSRGQLPVSFGEDGAAVQPGHVYVAPPDCHMLLESSRIRLDHGPKFHYTRPAADPLFISAAEAYGNRVMGIVLSGGDGDGSAGLRTIKKHGGIAIVQDPAEAQAPSMPRTAILEDHPDACLPVKEIALRVAEFCKA